MAELRINLRRQGLFKALDLFGNLVQALGVPFGLAAAFFIADDGEAFAESGGEVG